MVQTTAIPTRRFGRHDVQISALGFGGHHIGDAEDEKTAIQLIRDAVNGGVTFFDSPEDARYRLSFRFRPYAAERI